MNNTLEPAQDGRTKILLAAIRAFSAQGYEGTTTSAVARAAGVAQPLVHHHFGTKAGLWRAVMDHLLGPIAEAPEVPEGVSIAEVLGTLLEGHLRYCAEQPAGLRIVVHESMEDTDRLRYLVDTFLAHRYHGVVDLFRKGQEQGTLRADLRPELVLLYLLGAGTHFFGSGPLAKLTLDVQMTGQDLDDFVSMVKESFMNLVTP